MKGSYASPYLSCISASFPLPASIKEYQSVCVSFLTRLYQFCSYQGLRSSPPPPPPPSCCLSNLLRLYHKSVRLSASYLSSTLLSSSRLSLSLIPFGSRTVLCCSSAKLSPDLSSLPFIPRLHLFPSLFFLAPNGGAGLTLSRLTRSDKVCFCHFSLRAYVQSL